MSTVYLFGAGFSKDLADGPLMPELYARMKTHYDCEMRKEEGERDWRTMHFKRAEKVIKELEEAIGRHWDGEVVSSTDHGLRANIELLVTLFDALLAMPRIDFLSQGHPFEGYEANPLDGISAHELRQIRIFVGFYLPIVLAGLKVLDARLATFAEFVERIDRAVDSLVTFNYDLVLERGLWDLGAWTPCEGYVGVRAFEWELPHNEHKDAEARRRLGVSPCRICKLHGSINWQPAGLGGVDTPSILLWNTEESPPAWYFAKLGTRAFADPSRAPRPPQWADRRRLCRMYSSILIAPSLIKDVASNPVLAANWRECQRAIAGADQVVAIGYSFPKQDTASRLLLGLIRDDARLLIVAPDASGTAESLEGLVKSVEPIDKTFSCWVSDRCPGVEEGG